MKPDKEATMAEARPYDNVPWTTTWKDKSCGSNWPVSPIKYKNII